MFTVVVTNGHEMMLRPQQQGTDMGSILELHQLFKSHLAWLAPVSVTVLLGDSGVTKAAGLDGCAEQERLF